MPFYETVYETGRVSVANYDDDDQALLAAGEHDKRARTGAQGGPQGGPAERVAKIYKYDKHPNEYNPEQTASAEVLNKELGDLVKGLADENGVVNIDRLATEVRGLSHPMVGERESAHDSMFRMKETDVLTLPDEPKEKGSK